MTKKEFLKIISNKTGLSMKDTELFYGVIFETIKESVVSGEKITVADFGTFSVVDTKARKGVNPQTGKKIEIPASKKIKFAVSMKLREDLKKTKK